MISVENEEGGRERSSVHKISTILVCCIIAKVKGVYDENNRPQKTVRYVYFQNENNSHQKTVRYVYFQNENNSHQKTVR